MLGIDQADFDHGLSASGGYEPVIRDAAEENNLNRDFRGGAVHLHLGVHQRAVAPVDVARVGRLHAF